VCTGLVEKTREMASKEPIEESTSEQSAAAAVADDNNDEAVAPDLKDEQEALKRKAQGNELFGQGKYLEAYEEYTEAIRFAPITEDFAKNLAIFYCNRGACCLELGKSEEAVADCTKAIELDPKYLKAFIRRGKAHEKLDELDECLADMTSALEIDPKATNLKRDRDRMEVRVKEKHEKLKDEMIGKLKEMGNSVLGRFGMSLDNFKMEQDPSTGSYSVNYKQ